MSVQTSIIVRGAVYAAEQAYANCGRNDVAGRWRTVSGKRTGYEPVPVECVCSGTSAEFDLYVLRSRGRGFWGQTMVLYRRRGLPITGSHLKELAESGVRHVFVKSADAGKYRRYLQTNIEGILSDSHIDMATKASVVYQSAQATVEDVWADPGNPAALDRARALVERSVAHFMGSRGALHHFIMTMSHDGDTYSHCVNVCMHSLAMASRIEMSADSLAALGTGALLHDIGLTKVDHDVVEKQDFERTPTEREIYRRHPELGVEILRNGATLPEEVHRIVHEHHERCDGSGYPLGLQRTDTHVLARITAVADVFDSLTSGRIGGRKLSFFAALRRMRDNMLERIDETVWRQFVEMLGKG